MPELAEVKIMSDFVNTAAFGAKFDEIRVSDVVKKRLPLDKPNDLGIFSISSESRGKETLLVLTKKERSLFSYTILVSMGMTGHWQLADAADLPKHAHLSFISTDGRALCLVDPRRFARWKWSGWAANRGPCPLTDVEKFRLNIATDLNRRVFDRSIAEVLMDQKYFNGIGNYLRAEILYRANQDPFEPARDAIRSNPFILDLCTTVSAEAYLIGGGQLKDWKSPFSVPPNGFHSWIKCYGKADCSVDLKGRRLWYFSSQLKKK